MNISLGVRKQILNVNLTVSKSESWKKTVKLIVVCLGYQKYIDINFTIGTGSI